MRVKREHPSLQNFFSTFVGHFVPSWIPDLDPADIKSMQIRIPNTAKIFPTVAIA
jgi:hypothetical protein